MATGTGSPTQIAAYRLTRPARGLVLVPLPRGVPWQASVISAIRGQVLTWGGSANLPVPWTTDLLDRSEFWALARSLDADGVVVSGVSADDLSDLVPDIGARATDAYRQELERQGFRPAAIADAVERALREPFDTPDLQPTLQALAARLPTLQHSQQTIFTTASGSHGAGFPFVPVTELSERPQSVESFGQEELDLWLSLAAEYGSLHPRSVAALEGLGIEVSDDLQLERRVCPMKCVWSW